MRNWLFILIFSTLMGNMNAHQVQLVTHHEKTNGVLIRVVVSNVPEVKDIAGWVGQENWFYLTLNESVFAEGVLENLVTSSPILEIEGIQNKQSVQIGFLMENYISDFEIFHSQSNRVFLIHVWHELDGDNIADIKRSENKNNNKIFSIHDQNITGRPFYESFVDAREKYGPEKYFVWYDNWYSTEDKLDLTFNKNIKKEVNIWEKHWSGNETPKKEKVTYGPSLPKDSQEVKVSKVIVDTEKKEKVLKNNVIRKGIEASKEEKLNKLKEEILDRKKKVAKKESNSLKKDQKPKQKEVKPKIINKKSSEDLAAYAIEPNLSNRKTYLKIGCDLVDVNVYLDGRRVGKTPLDKRIPVSSGWHRIRIDVPGAKKFNKSGIPNPDFRDVFITKGRTQKVTFKFLNDQENVE
ncbi:MAG: hypothetical protein ACJZ19_03560 [Candidatus Neomarinimicrobiota bacterium]